MKDIEDTLVTVRVGKVVKGKVIQVGEDDVIVNIGYKADGVIPRDELSNDPTLKPSDIVSEGEEIEVFVKKIDEKEGSVLLSKKKVDIEKAWKVLKEKHQTGEPLNVKVLEEVKGGLIGIAEGIRGFIPASHIDIGYVEVLQDFVGQELSMKVIEFNRSKGKVIFSRKVLLEEEKEKKKKEILESLKAGDRIEGEVKRITDFGAFVDVGGMDGLVHISEMSWSRIEHPSEVLETGQRVEVVVLGVEPENERISLSLKKAKPHPWDNIQERYKAGDVVTGKIVRLVDFGAFVELEPGVEGLVHVSQIAYTHVEKPQDVLEEGQMVEVKVLDVKPDERRISLSIKETTEKPRREFNKEKPQAQQAHTEDHPPITIGELVGDIFKEEE
jgi:ribosomal protein S1